MDRAFDYGSKGWGFESLRDRFFQKEEYLWRRVIKMFFIKAVNNANNNFIKKKEKILLIKVYNK